MKQMFDWDRNLVYRDKVRTEYTMDEEGTLDELLYRMYMVAHDLGGLNMRDAVKALNVAYYMAVAIYNTPHVEETNGMNQLTLQIAENILGEEHLESGSYGVSEADVLLVRWMSLVILKLQRNKPKGLDRFLKKYYSDIISGKDNNEFDSEKFVQCGFSGKFYEMMKELENVSYDSDLHTNPVQVMFLSSLTRLQLKNLSLAEVEQVLRFYRTKEDQLSFLAFLKEEYIPESVSNLPF